MELTNKTTLRAYLAHIRGKAVLMAALRFEYTEHPENFDGAPEETETIQRIRKTWEQLTTDVDKALGVHLMPWHCLATTKSLTRENISGIRDPLRISMKDLKAKADKARLQDPTIALLESWDTEAKEPGC